jgi:hypothetical protein
MIAHDRHDTGHGWIETFEAHGARGQLYWMTQQSAKRQWRQRGAPAALRSLDGGARFREDTWEREGGGGGWSRVMIDGVTFEKAGINLSKIEESKEEEQQKGNKNCKFIVAVLVVVGFSWFISMKFSGGSNKQPPSDL